MFESFIFVGVSLIIPLLRWVVNIFVPQEKVYLFSRWNVLVNFLNLCIVWYVFLNFQDINSSYFYFDNINRFFYGLIMIISLIINIYSVSYFQKEIEHKEIWENRFKQYLFLSNFFIFSMLLVSVTNNLIMMWIWIEATTITTVFLISIYNTKSAWEAAWKYLTICTIWITIWLFGILMLLSSLDVSVISNVANFTNYLVDFDSSWFNINLVKIAFIFMFLWFATKAWIFPMHTWLPDAHGKWSTPISALMSSILLPLALYILIRSKFIVDNILNDTTFTSNLFLMFGLVTLVFSWLIMLKQVHFKRALAYSSSENMAITLIALSLNSWLWIFIAMIHIIAHAFIKSSAFMCVWNILLSYQSWAFKYVYSIPKYMKYTSLLLIIILALLIGMPPSPLFLTELLLISSLLKINIYFAMMMIFWLVLVFIWVLLNFSRMFWKENIYTPEVLDEYSLGKQTETKLSLLHFPVLINLFIVILILLNIWYFYDLFVN